MAHCKRFSRSRLFPNISTSIPRRFGAIALSLGLALISAGCGSGDRPPLGYVAGKVSVNGEPLSGAIVTFMPESGRPAVGTTDETGFYEIQYVQGVKGCKVGPNWVMFAVPTGGNVSQPIPAKYQSKSDLQAEVKSGKNTFDFDLESEEKASKVQTKPGVVD